jgi:integration host factor subunit beta
MTKAELVEEVTGVGDLTRKDAEVIVETIFDAVVSALRADDKVEIRGFGSFRTRSRKPRIGRNPKTGAKVEVPAKRVPFFKPSKELRDLVNGSPDAAAKSESKAEEPVLPIDPHHPPAM